MQRRLGLILAALGWVALAACESGGSANDAAPQADTLWYDDAEGRKDTTGQADRDLSRCGTGTESCGSCHGSGTNAAPPPDTAGNSDPSEITVGSHQTHVGGGTGFAAIPCSECHKVPTNVLDPGHCDSAAPAEVKFGTLASTGGTYPVWSRSTGTCQGTYCHGATLQGGATETPPWTSTTPLTCRSCHDGHGRNPSNDCACHSAVWSGGQIIDPTKHINGLLMN